MNVLDRLAEWWLLRRGRMVMPTAFRGMYVGDCYVQSVADGVYQVALPQGGSIGAFNNSIVNTNHALWPQE